MNFLKISLLIIIFQVSISSNAQDIETLCTKGLTYGEFISLFQIPTSDKLIKVIQQKCFEEQQDETASSSFVTYERTYEKSDGGTTTHYNELLTIKNGKAYEYECSEFEVCEKLLKKINDEAIYRYTSRLDSNITIYLLKDKQHVIEMQDIPDENIGYGYGFKYRMVNADDVNRLSREKLKDDFPKSLLERSKLEYRYERIDSYNNPTSVNVNAGDKVYFEAGGEIVLGFFAGSGGPDGIDGYTSYCRVEAFKHGSLLFKIGTSAWDAVSTEKNFVAKNSGTLQFLVNDNDPSNNSGHFWVDIKIVRAK